MPPLLWLPSVLPKLLRSPLVWGDKFGRGDRSNEAKSLPLLLVNALPPLPRRSFVRDRRRDGYNGTGDSDANEPFDVENGNDPVCAPPFAIVVGVGDEKMPPVGWWWCFDEVDVGDVEGGVAR